MSSNSIESRNPGSHWWLVLLQGIAAIILGVLLLTRPAGVIATIVFFLGIYWLVTGVVTLVSLLWDRAHWGLKLFTGILGIVAGLFIVRNPLISALVVPASIALWLGILGIAIGIGQLIQAFRGGGWAMGILGGLSILLGFLLITNPVIAGLSLAFWLGLLLVVGGFLAIFAAFRLRSQGKAYEEAQAMASRSAATGGSTASTTGSRAAGAVAAGTVAAGTVDAAGSNLVGAGSRAARAASNTAGGAATGVAGAAAAGAAAANRAGDGIGQAATDAADTAEDFAVDAAYAMRDSTVGATEAGGATGAVGATAFDGIAGAAAEGVDGAQEAGEGIVEAVEATFTGNVNPLDSEEMSKFKYPLEFIEGVGQASADKLRAIGINNCLDLIKWGSHAKGRAEIADKSGISGKRILTWVNHIDLYRIKGVGSEYADLLEAAGVDTVVELAQRNSANLVEKMTAVNQERKLVRKLPTQSQVTDWVSQAKGLPRVITY